MIEINVLQVVSGNDNGGGGIHVLNICNKDNKYFNNSICCIGHGDFYDRAKVGSYKMYFIDKVSCHKEFIKIVNENNFDIINFHGAKANFLHMVTKGKLKKPCVVTVHSDYRYDFLNSRIKKVLYTPLSVMSLKKYDNFICVSKALEKLLNDDKFIGDKWSICNGISFNVDYNKYKTEYENIKNTYGISEDDFVYIYVARLHPIKNHEKLINGFSKLCKNITNAKLLLVGDGQLMDTLKNQCISLGIDKKVIFTGQQSNTLKFIGISDVAMLTSFNEGGMPTMTILESALMKKPMICSDIGDVHHIINEKTGYLLNPNSEEDIMEKMLMAYENKSTLSKMGQDFYEYVKEHYSIDMFHESYYKIYKNVVDKKIKNIS